jgi:hypothetical protein
VKAALIVVATDSFCGRFDQLSSGAKRTLLVSTALLSGDEPRVACATLYIWEISKQGIQLKNQVSFAIVETVKSSDC